MKSTSLPLHAALFVLATLTSTRIVQADTPATCAEAESIFKVARAKVEAKDYDEAIPLLKQSLALCRSPKLGALYNLALAEQALGKTAAAYLHYAEFTRDVQVQDERYDQSKHAMGTMYAENAHLRFVNLEHLLAGSTVLLDDAAVGKFTTGYEIPAESGRHSIVIREPGQSERRLSVDMRLGQAQDVDVKPPKPSWFTRKNVGFVVGGVGVANLVAGVITGSLAWQKRTELTTGCAKPEAFCTTADGINNHIETGKTLGDASTATFIIGGALTAVGATLVLLPSKGTPSKEVAVVPIVLPNGGGLSFAASF